MVRGERITIKQVANEAGVSTQTVSRVFNLRPDVSPETRQRVTEVIERLGYHPSALARSLIQRRSFTLGVVTAGLKFIGPSRTLSGITEKAEELGFALLLSELPEFDAHNQEPVLRSLLARQVDGILWAVPEVGDNRIWVHDLLPTLPVPIIFLAMEPRADVAVVSIDNHYGGFIATQHLVEQGYQTICHIAGPLDWWEARQRKKGWLDALETHKLPMVDQQCVEGTWSSSSGEKAMRQLFQQCPDLDAVFVANDQMALGVLQVACREGLAVPERLGVVGFDGIAESAFFWPPLTTVSQDQAELGALAVQELVNAIEGTYQEEGAGKEQLGVESYSVVIKPQLLIRASSVKKHPDSFRNL
jgi:DNA-binding LacI/PurR family transcriptional regulator